MRELMSKLPEPLRTEVAHVIGEAQRLRALGDRSAWEWLPRQLGYLARKYPDYGGTISLISEMVEHE